MKRYIRLKDGQIFTIEDYKRDIQFVELADIEKTADTIEELIEVGDLVVYIDQNLKKDSLRQPEIAKVYPSQSGKELCCEGAWLKYLYKYITELYTKQGRNYVLVAEKVGGEWRIL